jgi:hypothetical protein
MEVVISEYLFNILVTLPSQSADFNITAEETNVGFSIVACRLITG